MKNDKILFSLSFKVADIAIVSFNTEEYNKLTTGAKKELIYKIRKYLETIEPYDPTLQGSPYPGTNINP